MNREEILAKSRNENENVLDERSKVIQTKANSISQGVGMILCIVMGAIGYALTLKPDILWCCTAILWGMFACERIVCAVKEKNVAQWVLAGVLIAGFIAVLAAYILVLLNRI